MSPKLITIPIWHSSTTNIFLRLTVRFTRPCKGHNSTAKIVFFRFLSIQMVKINIRFVISIIFQKAIY